MTDLSHRLALVTGSARGIGLACARALAAAGATVISTDIDDAAGLASLRSLGSRAQFHHLDVREEPDWQRVIQHALAEHGRLDVLVNNAGTTGFDLDLGPQDPEHASLDAWRAVHATNLDGVFLGCKYGIAAMRPRGAGSIINMSSRSGLVGIPAAAAYASSKAAIRNHTKTVALYCAEQGLAIRCNSLHPAAILTRMWEPMLGHGPPTSYPARDATAPTRRSRGPSARRRPPWPAGRAETTASEPRNFVAQPRATPEP